MIDHGNESKLTWRPDSVMAVLVAAIHAGMKRENLLKGRRFPQLIRRRSSGPAWMRGHDGVVDARSRRGGAGDSRSRSNLQPCA
jgi:hypothetical protein